MWREGCPDNITHALEQGPGAEDFIDQPECGAAGISVRSVQERSASCTRDNIESEG